MKEIILTDFKKLQVKDIKGASYLIKADGVILGVFVPTVTDFILDSATHLCEMTDSVKV